jgi:tetratricopeptide (TPR) repeat protein
LERLNAGQRDTIAALERQLGSTQEQIYGFLRIVGEAGIAVNAIPGKLVEIAERFQTLVAQAAATPGNNPEAVRLKAELHAALQRVDLDRADALLGEILDAQDRELGRRALEAAATCAQRGEVAMTRLRYRDAAGYFAAAANRVPAALETERIDYFGRQATALYLQGEEFGDNSALQSAGDVWRALLILSPRERVPLQWATTQNNLGAALTTLGERESGTARLEEAVAAFDACLTVVETVWPAEWVQQVRSHRDETQAEIGLRRATK